MSRVVERPSLARRLRGLAVGFDPWLLAAVALLAALGATVMYSAAHDEGGRFADHLRNLAIALAIVVVVAQVPPHRLMALAPSLYGVGVALLVATAVFGVTRKGATRWLNVGVVIQPSEVMKIAMPLMLAWWFQKREGFTRVADFVVAAAIVLVPVVLVARQPDLGTALLIASSGLYAIYFAGLSWRLIVPVVVAASIGVAALVLMQDRLCSPDLDWRVLRPYQKHRICTLLDPQKDPLGKGFHTLQGMIAIGSGGVTGKGLLAGTQTHLEFVPERSTDFAFAVLAEELGLLGALVLLTGFSALIVRGLAIAEAAPTMFTRLLAGTLSLGFFTYVFVNVGMVAGILPVVGVPLPFVSYGGTAMVTLGLGLGMLMSIARQRDLMQR